MTEPVSPEPTAPKAIPDLGFFAGPARSGSPFGGASAAVGAQSAGQLGGAAGNQFGAPAANQFGSAPAVNQFGSVPAVNQFGSAQAPVFGGGVPPGYAAPSLQRKSTSGLAGISAGLRGGAVSLVGLILVSVVIYNKVAFVQNLFSGPLESPAALVGTPRMTGPEIEQIEQKAKSEMTGIAADNGTVGVYAQGPTIYVLLAQRGRADIDKELDTAGIPEAQRVSIGESTCGAKDGEIACLRTSGRLSVVVISNLGPEQTAAAVDEAWDAF